MADLLSASDWSEIRSALQDVMDTFFKLPVTYVRRTSRKLHAFHEDRAADLTKTSYPLFALMVPDSKDDDDSKSLEVNKGYADLSEGYVYFNYQSLANHTPALIDANGRPAFIANKDSLVLLGKEVTITGVNLVGPTQSNFQLVKVHYKQEIARYSEPNYSSALTTDSGTTLTTDDGDVILPD